MTETDAREQILSAAEDLYYRKGYAAVGMDELRTAAGVSLRRLYALFPSKIDVIAAVLQRKHEEWEAALEAAVTAAGDSARGRLLAVYGHLERWFCDDDFRGCAFINAFGELGGNDPEVARVVREHKAAFQERMAVLAEEAGVPRAVAFQLSILAEGAQTTAAIAAAPDAARHARAAAEILIDASLATHPPRV
ncbi:MAG: TetR family transcriptional regulator [Microbacterium sp. 69-10]|uniref:TetR/AcrR family transcriptional regulator n=1 Tax=Microbacterium sp. 69-10 TaxID=1895783 RepID=UPI000969EF9E|nr:TetR/AcrR family transcriptional regulator [Microbacterium sp. 69-10]OJU41171.1 MAG: TetR family transcriptional regulator [Microbacterium sp. 69-10]